MSTQVAIFGGAFNPPHLAHLFTVTYLLGRQDVDQVWLVPTASHVFGKEMAPVEDRLEMLNQIVQAYGWTDRVHILDIEARREGASRTIDTLTALSDLYPGHEFRWVIGADNLTERHRWHRFDDLVARWSLIVLGRPGHEDALAECAPLDWCEPGPTLPGISSTQLRAALRGTGPREVLRWLPSVIGGQAAKLYPPRASDFMEVAILGMGRMGTTLTRALSDRGARVQTWNRSLGRSADFHGDLPPSLNAPIWLLTVTDDAIGDLVAQLMQHPGISAKPTVLHCAGRLGADVLGPLQAAGCAVGVLHPLQAIRGGAHDLDGAWCVASGDDSAVEAGRKLASLIGAHFAERTTDDPECYHAAAVLAANFVTTLSDAGIELLTALGIEREAARKMLATLVIGTAEHLSHTPPADALTGPFSRKDFTAIQAHIGALNRRAPHLLNIYRGLARQTARMLSWSVQDCDRLDEILGSAAPDE